MKESLDFIKERGFILPPFVLWGPEDWADKGEEYDELKRNMLGWDITDFGQGDFDKIGLFLITLRNGNQKSIGDGNRCRPKSASRYLAPMVRSYGICSKIWYRRIF